MGNPKQPNAKSRTNTHNEASRLGNCCAMMMLFAQVVDGGAPTQGHSCPSSLPPSTVPRWLYSPPDAPPHTKWPPTSISTADGSCWNLCAIWVSATPPLLPGHLPPRPLWGTPLLIWLEIKKHLNGISLASPAATAAAEIGMINVLVFVILFIVQISPKKKKKLSKFYRMYKTHFL